MSLRYLNQVCSLPPPTPFSSKWRSPSLSRLLPSRTQHPARGALFPGRAGPQSFNQPQQPVPEAKSQGNVVKSRGNPFFCPAPNSGREALSRAGWSESIGVLTTSVSTCDLLDPCQEKLSGPQVAASPPPQTRTEEGGVTQRKAYHWPTQLHSSGLEIFYLGQKQARKHQILNCSSEADIIYSRGQRHSSPKGLSGTVKVVITGSWEEIQDTGQLVHRREQGNNTRWEELSWGQKKWQTLTSETIPSMEPEFNRISL